MELLKKYSVSATGILFLLQNIIRFVLIKRRLAMRINGKVYFDSWVGDNYESGIKGDKILVIGLQHWCDPKYWNCDKDPHKCLDERDSICTVWNAECYRPKDSDKNLDENAQKPSGWEHLGEKNDKMPNCPILEKCNKRNECNGTKDNTPRLRYLHCETKISVYNHINDQERAQRAAIFGAVLLALEELYSINFKNNKKKCWNSIAFTNFIQHYTKIDSENPNRIDINNELTEVLSEKNLKALDQHIENLKPKVIIALKIDMITSIIKGTYRDKYVECKDISIMTPMGGTFTFSVFAEKDSHLYIKIKQDLNDFVDDYIRENLQIVSEEDFKNRGKKRKIESKIQALAIFLKEQIKETEKKHLDKYRKIIRNLDEFLKEQKKQIEGTEKKHLDKYSEIKRDIQVLAKFFMEQREEGKNGQLVTYRDEILKNENIAEIVRKEFYYDKDFKQQKNEVFKEFRSRKKKELLDAELDRIKAAYEDFKEKRRNI